MSEEPDQPVEPSPEDSGQIGVPPETQAETQTETQTETQAEAQADAQAGGVAPETSGEGAPADAAAAPPGEERPASPEEPAGPRLDGTILLIGVVDSSRQVIARDDLVVTDDPGDVGNVDVVVVSTRVPRVQVHGLVSELRPRTTKPIIALAHAGGEAGAVEIMRAGGDAVVAEGNELAIRALLADLETPATLTETYDAHMGRRRSREGVGGRGRDPVTNLATASGFDNRLREFEQAEEPVRVGFMRIQNFEHASRRLTVEATGILRRRLAMQYTELCRSYGVDLFALGPAEFAFVAGDMSPARAERFGAELAKVTESFAPTAHGPLGLAVGHAGPELSSEIASLRELAQRAVALAAVQEDSVVIGAEELSRTLTSTTELEVALRMLQAIERHDPHGASHGMRVADFAAEVAQRLGFDGHERAAIRFAAHVHDIGKIGLPVEAMYDLDDADPETTATYRTHPERGAAYLRVAAGRDAAAVVRAHHERFDGSGFPDGLAGQDIPIGARIVAVADSWDRWSGGRPDEVPADGLIERFREHAGSWFDPGVVDAVVELLTAVAARQASDEHAAVV